MTWEEFKAFIDGKIKEQGIKGEERIWFIDVTYPQALNVEIEATEDGISIFDLS